ncbi:MAG: SUMF1/EgtB/PvdO family nonheme iron enzyme [Labilithrix sp.]|nr:SUMF1/EgtB/PvdO family nonheme iron enzyme [Labilithrix sp.]
MLRVLDAGFCIDTTEVTLEQYQDFLAAKHPIPPECSWKTDYTLASFTGKAAVGNVDWCDAYSFCQWAGKRLCGGIGGVVLDLQSSLTPQSEWQYACTHGGDASYAWPYGSAANANICLYSDSPDSGQSRPVASDPRCVGPEGVFDLSGNVWEWEDACDRTKGASRSAQCNLRGGGFLRSSNAWGSCAAVPAGWTRESHVEDTGIRCCSDFK